MITQWKTTWGAGVAAAVLATALTVSAQTPAAPTVPAQPPAVAKGAAATIGDEVISLADLEKSIATELASLEEQRYRALDRKLGQMIAERLVASEAKKRGVSVEALLNAEITAKTPPVTAEDVATFIAQNRARLRQGDEADLKVKVADYLSRMQAGQRLETYVASLRAKTPVQVYLTPPDPIRLSVDPKIGFVRGPETAPVTIVEFSDFHCPFCKTVVGTLKQIVTTYADRVRWVFRDYPIAALHPEAAIVHEAARCAGDQGKFGPYHDLAFERAPVSSPNALRAIATEVGVEAAAFGLCLETRKYRAVVASDIEAGSKLGITGTPTFFINGALLVGNQPLGDFQRLIERELSRTAAKH